MTTKENLFKDIYYDRKVRNILDRTGEIQVALDAAICDKKVKKSKTRLQVLYNSLLILAVVLVFIYLTNAWFVDNTVVEMEQMQYNVVSPGIPVYSNLNFNTADCGEYDNTEILLTKAIIPGDVVDLSVFIELVEIPNVKTVEVKILGVPEWFNFKENSEAVTYADKIPVMIDGDRVRVTLERFEGETEGLNITDIAFSNGTVIFTLDVPEGYAEHDGVCIDFGMYFEDTDDNQNMFMNEPVRMRFTASKV